MDFVTVFAGVLFANILTAMLIYGAVRMNRIQDERNLDFVTACCFLTPLGFAALGLYLATAG